MAASPTVPAEHQAYVSIMRDLKELDLGGTSIPSHLTLTGDNAFPLAMNCKGKVFMAASTYSSGRIVVFGHESYLTTLPELVENALLWLRGDGSTNLSVGVHKAVKGVADNLSKSSLKAQIMDVFSSENGIGVYVTDAYSIEGKAKDIVAFMKSGGGVLIAGQAWWWASQNPNGNPLLHFPGNKVSGVAGIYFTKYSKEGECISVPPEIPHCWRTAKLRNDFKSDLEHLLHGVSELHLTGGTFSVILVHGPLSFPVCTSPDGHIVIAAGYYGKGRVVVVSHEGVLANEKMSLFWSNVTQWLDKGRNGTIGVELKNVFNNFHNAGINCQNTGFKPDLSVFVRTAYGDNHIEEIREFVAEGGGLLVGGHAWNWAQGHKDKNYLLEFPGNKLLNPMGLTLLSGTVSGGVYQAPDPSNGIKDNYHFRHILYRFARHVTKDEDITPDEEKCLTKLEADCASYLRMGNYNCISFAQLVSMLADILKQTGMPEVSEKCPAKTPEEHLLLSLASEVYKVHPNKEELLGHLLKDNSLLPALYDHKVEVNVNTAGGEEWVSTGLYLSPGMRTYMSMPAEIINKGWKVQVGCQTDHLRHKELKRAPRVCERYPVNSQMMLVHNLWGGLIYLIAPPHTKVAGAEVVVQVGVPVPYYKSGKTSLSDWQLLRTAPSPWAELEFENIILTLPSSAVRNLDRPDELAALWDKIMRAIADLAATPHKFARKERIVSDVQITNGWMHAGYPIMSHTASAAAMVDAKNIMAKGMWGPIHELGHNQQRGCWEFPPHTTEATCNLWSVYVHENVFNIPREKAHGEMQPGNQKKSIEGYVKSGKNLKQWQMWVALQTYMQLQTEFGWDAFKKVFTAYQNMSSFPKDNPGKMNLYALTFSETVGMNLMGFFKAWGWPLDENTVKKVSNLPAWTDHPMAKYK